MLSHSILVGMISCIFTLLLLKAIVFMKNKIKTNIKNRKK